MSLRAEVAAVLHEQFSRLSRKLHSLELPQGMTPERLSALSTIDRVGPISIHVLADLEMVRPASTSRMVKALVDDGLVKCGKSKDDRRGVLVTTTPKGRRLYQRAHEQRLRYFADALEQFSNAELITMRALAMQLERFVLLDAKG